MKKNYIFKTKKKWRPLSLDYDNVLTSCEGQKTLTMRKWCAAEPKTRAKNKRTGWNNDNKKKSIFFFFRKNPPARVFSPACIDECLERRHAQSVDDCPLMNDDALEGEIAARKDAPPRRRWYVETCTSSSSVGGWFSSTYLDCFPTCSWIWPLIFLFFLLY